MKDTLFLGWGRGDTPRLSLEKVLQRHVAVRDAVAEIVHGETDVESTQWPYIATLSFTYAFNAYKAIELLLPHKYYEAAACILRQQWEVSLNLHWLEQDTVSRCQDFCNFTVMEYRRLMAAEGAPQTMLTEFDSATSRFQKNFRLQDGKGRTRRHSTFAGMTVHERSVSLGDPWESDYRLLFRLTSMHTHGAPGAILRPLFLANEHQRKSADVDSSALMGLVSIQLLVRDVHLLVRQSLASDSAGVDLAAAESEDPEGDEGPSSGST